MAAPFSVKDLGEVAGSWPITRDQNQTSFSQAPNSLEAQATILGFRREPSAGFLVGGAAIDIVRDVATVPTTTQVTFTLGNKTLAEVISAINTAVGAAVASNDNGFLRLSSPTIGGDSYLRVDSVAGSESATWFLGILEGQEARGGDYRQTQHIDPFRSVAMPGQSATAVGENMDSSALNRGFFQLGVNAGAANAQLSVGRRTRKVRETLTADGNEAIQIGTSDPTRGVFVGSTSTPTSTQLRQLVRVLDASGEEYTKLNTDIIVSTTCTVTAAGAGTGVARLFAASGSTVAGLAGRTTTVGLYVQFSTAVGGLESRPRKIVSQDPSDGDYMLIEAVNDSDGSTIQPPTTTLSGGFAIGEYSPVVVTGFYDTFTAPSTFGSRVEGVQSSISGASGGISWSAKGNRINLNVAAPGMQNAQVGDLLNITGSSTSIPWSNDGSYRIQRILDTRNVDVINADYTPAFINPISIGGTGTASTDGQFVRTPYIRFAPEGTLTSLGGGAVPASGDTIIVEYYVEDTYTDILNRDGDFLGPLPSNLGSSGALRSAFQEEHDLTGRHTNISVDNIFFGSSVEPTMRGIGDRGQGGWAMFRSEPQLSPALSLDDRDSNTTLRIASGMVAVGDYAGAATNVRTPASQGVPPQLIVSGDYDTSGFDSPLDVWLGSPQTSVLPTDLQLGVVDQQARLWLCGTRTRADSELLDGIRTDRNPAMLAMGTQIPGTPDTYTWFAQTMTQGATEAALVWHFKGFQESFASWENPTSGLDNLFILSSTGGVGLGLGAVADRTPRAPVHISGFSEGQIPGQTNHEVLRITSLDASGSTGPVVAYSQTIGNPHAFEGFTSLNDWVSGRTVTDANWFWKVGVDSTVGLDPSDYTVMQLFGRENTQLATLTLGNPTSTTALNIQGDVGNLTFTGTTSNALTMAAANSVIDVSGTGSEVRTTRLQDGRVETSSGNLDEPLVNVRVSRSLGPSRSLFTQMNRADSNSNAINPVTSMYLSQGGSGAGQASAGLGDTTNGPSSSTAFELAIGAVFDDGPHLWRGDMSVGSQDALLYRWGVGSRIENTDRPAFELLRRANATTVSSWADEPDPSTGWERIFAIHARQDYRIYSDAHDLRPDYLDEARFQFLYEAGGEARLLSGGNVFASMRFDNIPSQTYVKQVSVAYNQLSGGTWDIAVYRVTYSSSGSALTTQMGSTLTVPATPAAGEAVVTISPGVQIQDNEYVTVEIRKNVSATDVTVGIVELEYSYSP